MANKKSAKKRVLTNEKRRMRNVARCSDMKTAARKVEEALLHKETDRAVELLRSAESKIARASGKGALKKRTAARKISRLATKVSAALKLLNEK